MSKWRAFLAGMCVVLVVTSIAAIGQVATAQDSADTLLVYHQLTNRTTGITSLGTPIISGDGQTAVFAESGAQLQDPENPNIIFVVETVSGHVRQADTYEALCFCVSWVDIDNFGNVVSTDSVQIRSGGVGTGDQLLKLDGNEITGFKVSGDGTRVFFIIRRDTSADGGKTAFARGVYSMPVGGGTPKKIVGVEEVAAAINVPVADMLPFFHFDANPNLIDVTADGSLVTFGAFAGAGEYVFTVSGSGGAPEPVAGPFDIITHAAISGDGATIAWDMVEEGSYDLGILRSGKATTLLDINNEVNQPLQLNADGKWLLIGTNGSLIDTDALTSRPLATPASFSGRSDTLLSGGMDRTSMSSDGKRFLYALPANPANAFEQLATLSLSPPELGIGRLIRDARVDPSTLKTGGSVFATATVSVVWDGELVGVGLGAVLNGEIDQNIGGGEIFIDTSSRDPNRGQGIFVSKNISYLQRVARDDDTGPRTLRVHAEVKTADGLYHATAVDFGTLNVVE